MKIKRQKKVHRYLNFYKNNFNFRLPYQVLIDGTFCQAALKYKVNIKEQLPKYLEGEIKYITTACVITETEKLGPKLYGAMLIIKQFIVHKCGHEKNPIAASDCLLSMLGTNNNSHYVMATQDQELKKKAQRIPAVPILFLNYNTPTLEKPSRYTEKIAKNQEDAKFVPSAFEKETLKTLKRKHFGEEPKEIRKKRKRKGGPNPLSCKKSKKKKIVPDSSITSTEEKRCHKRKRIRVAKHVKEHFKSLTSDVTVK